MNLKTIMQRLEILVQSGDDLLPWLTEKEVRYALNVPKGMPFIGLTFNKQKRIDSRVLWAWIRSGRSQP